MHRWTAALFFVFFLPSVGIAQTSESVRTHSLPDVLQMREGWSLQNSCKVEQKGELISTPEFAPTGWYTVSVPTTVVGAMVKHKVYRDPMLGMNWGRFPGVTDAIGKNFAEREGLHD